MRTTRRFRGLMVAAMVVGMMLSATAAQASPITYTFSGIGSGSVGATSFTDKAFTFSFLGNSENVVWNSDFQIWVNLPISPATVDIAGFGSGTVVAPPMLVWSRDNNAWGLSPSAGFGDSLYAVDYLYLYNPSFVGNPMTTSFGPVSGPGGGGTLATYAGMEFPWTTVPSGYDPTVMVNYGAGNQLLVITPSGDMTFSASVPDGGATLVLLGGVLMGLGALRRKFRA